MPSTPRRFLLAALLGSATLLVACAQASAFCGFYVAKADTRLFNKASQVVLVRDGERTVITMANDFKGDLTQFAVVVPVPTFIERGQIHVGDKAVLEHLDAYTAPRLVEYFDDNPCATFDRNTSGSVLPAAAPMMQWRAAQAAEQTMGVKIEASYTVGEYDILILSATQSSGLATWLRDNGYRIPPGAAEVLGSYIRQNMRFFVAKVNVTEQVRLGFSMLRPLQVAYESPKFMLPIRLGMVNADGPQELFVYALTKNGRVETTNYRTVKLSTGLELPPYVKESDEFGRMYKALFSEQVRRENMSAVFLEYAWDMSSCDPCAAEPLTSDELRRLGVFWAGDGAFSARRGSAGGVFVSRLHVRYDQAHFPEDLMLQETGDQAPFQGRYIVRHPWQGGDTCSGATTYRRELRTRQEREAQTLASATGWRLAEVRKRMGLDDRPGAAPSWDNVIYGAPGLGYVDAMHQSLQSVPGATVLTYYLALGDMTGGPGAGRRMLLAQPWSFWRDRILAELSVAHPDLATQATRMDITRHGHAMAVPVPRNDGQIGHWPLPAGGYSLSKSERHSYVEGRLAFAHGDWAGYSVFEEAFTLGHQAGLRAVG